MYNLKIGTENFGFAGVMKGEGERTVDSNDGHSKELLRSSPTILHTTSLILPAHNGEHCWWGSQDLVW